MSRWNLTRGELVFSVTAQDGRNKQGHASKSALSAGRKKRRPVVDRLISHSPGTLSFHHFGLLNNNGLHRNVPVHALGTRGNGFDEVHHALAGHDPAKDGVAEITRSVV